MAHFRMGVNSANFHASGNILVVKEALMIHVIEGRMAGRQSLITPTGILSVPGALCVAIDLTIAFTCCIPQH